MEKCSNFLFPSKNQKVNSPFSELFRCKILLNKTSEKNVSKIFPNRLKTFLGKLSNS